MEVYKHDGSGTVHVFHDSEHFTVNKGQVTKVLGLNKAPVISTLRKIESKILSKSVRKIIHNMRK